MNKTNTITARFRRVLALFVMFLLGFGCALLANSLRVTQIAPATNISISDYQTPSVMPTSGQDDWILLDSTSTIKSYARKFEDQIFVVVLNNSAAYQWIVINLGSRWISCSGVKNVFVDNDPNIWLNHPGSGIDSLSVKLNAGELKIIECEQETSLLAVDHSILNSFPVSSRRKLSCSFKSLSWCV